MPANTAAPAQAGHRFTIIEAEEVRLDGRAGAAAASLGRPAPVRHRGLAPAPRPRGRQLARAAGEEDGEPNDTPGEEAGETYRLSQPPADVKPPVAVAQGMGAAPGRGLRSQAMQVVEIASTVAGAAMTRVLDNQGDVNWELDQMPRDAVHPGGAAVSPGSGVWQAKTITLPGLRCENKLGQETFADFEVAFKYNGASVGFIEVSTIKAQDAWGWGLTVKETITADPNAYDTVPPSGARFAAAGLRFHFRFDHTPLQDVIGIVDLTLYGNGTFAETSRWTQP